MYDTNQRQFICVLHAHCVFACKHIEVHALTCSGTVLGKVIIVPYPNNSQPFQAISHFNQSFGGLLGKTSSQSKKPQQSFTQ